MNNVTALAPVRTRAEILREQRLTSARADRMDQARNGIYDQLKLAGLRPVERLAVLCSVLQEENHSAGASLPP
jgi:hypothetical protein